MALLGVEPRPLTNRVSVLPLHYRRSSKITFINKLKTLPIDLAKPDVAGGTPLVQRIEVRVRV